MESSSQLTNSIIFQRGRYTTNQKYIQICSLQPGRSPTTCLHKGSNPPPSHLRRRALKLGRLIVLQKTHLWLWNILFPWQLTLFQSPPTWFQYVNDFQPEKRWTRPQTQPNILICLLHHVYEAPFANMKMGYQRWPEMPLIWGRSGTQYVAMVTKLLSSNCGAHLVESYSKESNISDTNRLRYPFSSWCHHLTNLHILKTWISLEQKEIFENSKMALIEKMRFSS